MKTEFIDLNQAKPIPKTELTHCCQSGLENTWFKTKPCIEYAKIVYLGDYTIRGDKMAVFACYPALHGVGMTLWAGTKGSEFI